MTSHDVRDMLDLPSSSSAPRPKKVKTVVQKPKLGGLAREVQNLGGDNPIVIVPEEAVFKKKRFGSRKPATKWEARRRLRGGRRKSRGRGCGGGYGNGGGWGEGKGREEEIIEDSTFAKYNVKVQVPTYTDEQYKEILQSENWSREETDYLMRTVQEYDLRWPVIWDRYEYVPQEIPEDIMEGAIARRERTIEDLKVRYYTIGAAYDALKKPLHQMNTTEFDLHQKMLNFDPYKRLGGKISWKGVFTRTKEEAREEESLMVELKRILARSEKFMEERRELYARLDAPASSYNISAFITSQVKKRKPIQEGQTPGGATPVGGNTPGGYDARRDSNVRESVSAPSGNAGNASAVGNKKGSISSIQTPSDRRRLTEEEEKVYGVSHHDRLQGGPYFRGEKLIRPLTSKSAIQQGRIKNMLVELGIPEKPIMGTADVAHGYDELFKSIGILLDSKKVAEKLQTEIDVLKAQLEEKKRRRRMSGLSAAGGLDGTGDEKEEAKNKIDGNGEGGSEVPGAAAVVQSTESGENGAENEQEGGDGAQGNGENNGTENADANTTAAPKRSASVMSTGTDKSSKRQKK
ncbi:uncharacterized protein EAF02_006048 [Botrytis sinoallii]|uniref:uncharacterized protein n=1 Tax=Botrytis sinoallii TaxID=1463999 RepID=UPI0019023C47|nr:uncharacterized protein EAF02_006048 [Botrytis sinoallii]KAF7882685.1 hypothetical protein EAF02_006048 [Botrytis sinoallii]